jgi:hypothetical protein
MKKTQKYLVRIRVFMISFAWNQRWNSGYRCWWNVVKKMALKIDSLTLFHKRVVRTNLDIYVFITPQNAYFLCTLLTFNIIFCRFSSANTYCGMTANQSVTGDHLFTFAKSYASFHGYISICVCVFGIITNLFNIIVLTRNHMRTPVNIILSWISIG